MIYFPLNTLKKAGVKDILIITTPDDQNNFIKLLGNGGELGVNLTYKVQNSPEGIAQAFLIAGEFIRNSTTILILGDNLFFGEGIEKKIKNAINNNSGATIFGCKVNDPERFGVIEYDKKGQVKKLIEKPKNQNPNGL